MCGLPNEPREVQLSSKKDIQEALSGKKDFTGGHAFA